MCSYPCFSFVDDTTRVHLLEGPDYINANFLNVSYVPTWKLLSNPNVELEVEWVEMIMGVAMSLPG